MQEVSIGMLHDLWDYLQSRLFERPGLLWWGVALVAGLFAYVLCTLYARRTGMSRDRALPVGLLVGYTALIVGVTVLSRSVGTERGPSLVVAGGVSNLLRGGDTNPDWVANAAMLLPMGILLPEVTGWSLMRTALSCLAFSAWIEAVQYVCTLGYPELIDVALNVLGAVVGYGVWTVAAAVRRRSSEDGGSGGEAT